MAESRTLLIIANRPSPNTRRLASATIEGAHSLNPAGIEVRFVEPLVAEPDDVLAAAAIILGTTENFGYMSGALKHFFDRVYYPCLEQTEALPYALYVRAGKDGTGACRAVESICSGLRWRAAQPALILRGNYRAEFETRCRELGMTLAAGLDAGIL